MRVLTCLGWVDDDALEDYKGSEAWAEHRQCLADLSAEPTAMVIHRFYFRYSFIWSSTPYTSITDTYFPADIDDDEVSALEHIRGLRAHFVRTGSESYYTRPGVRGWAKSTYNGRPALLLRFVDFWNEGKEEVFKEEAPVFTKDFSGKVWQLFMQDLNNHGMLKMEQTHVDIRRFRQTWQGNRKK